MAETIVITNFGGRLTRVTNGDLDSGFAKFNTSWGYDPFSKPMNLTWLETPTDITGPINNLPLVGKFTNNSATTGGMYVLDAGGSLYNMQLNSASSNSVDSVVGIASVTAGGIGYTQGASMEFFGNTRKIYISGQDSVHSIGFDGTAETVVTSANRMAINKFHPLKQFIGKLFFGNGTTLGAIDNTGTVTSTVASVYGSQLYSELNPVLPTEANIMDLDTSITGEYLMITAANKASDIITTPSFSNNANNSYNVDSGLYKWNGTDAGVTASIGLPTMSTTALQTYLNKNYFFSNDSFGSSVGDEGSKILSLPNNKSPLPNATAANGNFLTWACPESATDGTARYASLYYFGSLDQDSPPGLFRLMRYTTTLASGFVYQVPLNVLVTNSYQEMNSALTAVIKYGLGKHYIGIGSVNSSSTYQYKLLSFLMTPTTTGTPQLGVYETQTQFFSKRMAIKSIRVYSEPTAANNGFQIDVIGSDGTIFSNGTFNYTFTAGSDITLLQGALTRVEFYPTSLQTFAFGLRITNTGTTNMTIKKIEVDVEYAGR